MKVSLLLKKIFNFQSFYGQSTFLEISSRMVLQKETQPPKQGRKDRKMEYIDRDLEQKVAKIILCDDDHTTTAWNVLNRFTGISVEHEQIARVKAEKSLVDHKLVSKVCREVYRNYVDSVVLFASDSDYWGMISEVAEANFLVMVERSKCSQSFEKAMTEAGISYACIDDFCTGDSYAMKASAVITELRHRLDNFRIDIRAILEDSVHAVRAEMSEKELQQFYDRYVRHIQLNMSQTGEISLELGV